MFQIIEDGTCNGSQLFRCHYCCIDSSNQFISQQRICRKYWKLITAIANNVTSMRIIKQKTSPTIVFQLYPNPALRLVLLISLMKTI